MLTQMQTYLLMQVCLTQSHYKEKNIKYNMKILLKKHNITIKRILNQSAIQAR